MKQDVLQRSTCITPEYENNVDSSFKPTTEAEARWALETGKINGMIGSDDTAVIFHPSQSSG